MFYDFNFPRPSPQAYKIWAEAIQPVIDQVFPPGSAAPAPASVQSQSPTAGRVGGTITWPQPPLPPGVNPAVVPAPPMERLNRFQQAIDDARKMPEVGLIFDGDSITAGWKGGGGGVWGHHYTKLNAVDFGISGDTTQGLLWRVRNGQADGLHPKLIVLLIGTNNMSSCSAEQIAEGIKADVGAYREHCPDATILLQGILPRGEPPTEGCRAKVKAVNKIISALADEKVIFLDWGDKLLLPDGTYTKPITNDFLHPNAPGYQIWADAIQPMIDRFFPPDGASTPIPAKQ
jgi:N-acetylglucosamine-6-sulfatase